MNLKDFYPRLGQSLQERFDILNELGLTQHCLGDKFDYEGCMKGDPMDEFNCLAIKVGSFIDDDNFSIIGREPDNPCYFTDGGREIHLGNIPYIEGRECFDGVEKVISNPEIKKLLLTEIYPDPCCIQIHLLDSVHESLRKSLGWDSRAYYYGIPGGYNK